MQLILQCDEFDVDNGDIVDMKDIHTVDSNTATDMIKECQYIMYTATAKQMLINYDMLKQKAPKVMESNCDECLLSFVSYIEYILTIMGEERCYF
jgi:hypothetical protein